MKILNLARPTPGDRRFYSRWGRIGDVVTKSTRGADIDILVVDHRVLVTNEFLAKYPNVKYVCSATTGWTHLLADGVGYITLRGEKNFLRGVRSVSELIMKYILNWYRPWDGMGRTLRGKTLAIVGCESRIGTHLHELASAFKMNVLGWDKQHPKNHLKEIFKLADIASIHIQEVPRTVGIINKITLDHLKKSSYLINTARPSIVDNVHLMKMLNEDKLAGAAVDFSIGAAKNLITTPHIGGSTLEDRIATDKFIVNKLKIILDTDHLPKNAQGRRRHRANISTCGVSR